MFVADTKQMQEIDRRMIEQYSYPGLLLMETAGRKAAEFILEKYVRNNFLILIGPGNNGGDGLVIARYLHQKECPVHLLFVHPPDQLKGDSEVNFRIIEQLKIPYSVFDPKKANDIRSLVIDGTVIVDALLGTGSEGPLRSPFQELVNALRSLHISVVAVDLPSGLHADTGKIDTHPLRCDYTLTFQLPKSCHYITPAASFCGVVVVLDIGIYPEVIQSVKLDTQIMDHEMIRRWYLPREMDVHKGSYGHVLAAGGSKGKSGAIALTSRAALEMGAGLCTAFIPGSVACAFHRTTLENMSIPYGTNNTPYLNETAAEVFLSYLSDKDVVAIGPGLGQHTDTYDFMKGCLEQVRLPLVLDADALNILAEHPHLWDALNLPDGQSNTIITPHPGEIARLMDLTVSEVQERRLECARALAAQRNVIVILKGVGTIVAAPNGKAFISTVGNPGMASAGVGDILTGVVAGLIAQGYNLLKAAVMGVYLHAVSAEIIVDMFGHEGVTAGKIARYLGAALKKVLETEEYSRVRFQ